MPVTSSSILIITRLPGVTSFSTGFIPINEKTNTDLPALVAGKRNSPFAFVDVPVVVPFSKIVTPGNGFPSVSMTSPS